MPNSVENMTGILTGNLKLELSITIVFYKVTTDVFFISLTKRSRLDLFNKQYNFKLVELESIC